MFADDFSSDEVGLAVNLVSIPHFTDFLGIFYFREDSKLLLGHS